MTLAAPFLWWFGGFLACSGIVAFTRHKGIGLVMILIAGLLTFWASMGTTLKLPAPQVNPSPVHSSSSPSSSHSG